MRRIARGVLLALVLVMTVTLSHADIRFDGAATTTSGAPYTNQFVWIFKMQDGRAVEAEAFLDLVAYQEVIDNNEPHPR